MLNSLWGVGTAAKDLVLLGASTLAGDAVPGWVVILLLIAAATVAFFSWWTFRSRIVAIKKLRRELSGGKLLEKRERIDEVWIAFNEEGHRAAMSKLPAEARQTGRRFGRQIGDR